MQVSSYWWILLRSLAGGFGQAMAEKGLVALDSRKARWAGGLGLVALPAEKARWFGGFG